MSKRPQRRSERRKHTPDPTAGLAEMGREELKNHHEAMQGHLKALERQLKSLPRRNTKAYSLRKRIGDAEARLKAVSAEQRRRKEQTAPDEIRHELRVAKEAA